MFSQQLFSDRILALRKEKGILQSQLGKAIGLSQVAISRIEKGDRAVSVEVLCALVDFFDVSADYLLGLTDDPARH